LAGCGLVVITFLFGRAVAGFRCGLLCGLILTTSLGILVLVRLAITDMVLTFFIAGSLYSFYLALRDDAGPRSASWASIGWAAAALAVLTKGPIGILFPAAIVPLFIWLSGHSQQWSYLRIRTGAAVLCLILLPWYVAEAYVTQGEFLRVFFVKHNILRYLAVNSDHSGPWFYYLVVILAGFLPWSAFLPASVSAGWKYRSQAAGSDREPDLPLFLLLWASVVLVFFSLAQTKLPNYVAPLFPALSLLVGWWCDRFLLSHPDRSARLSAIGGGLLSFIFAALFLLFYGFMESLQSQVTFLRALSLSSDFGLIPLFLSLTSACVGSGFFLLLRPGKAPHGVAVIAVSMMFFAFGLYQSVMPRVSAHLQEPVRGIAKAAAKRFEAETRLVVFGLNNPSILFYTKRPAILLGKKNFSDLAEYLKQSRPMLVITNASLAEKLTGVHTVEQRGRYVLLTNRDHERK
jgi:4-amino-4-deoxy-L-arabinose transferase-like glycosyltransferase